MKRRVQDKAVSTIIFDCDDVLLDWQEGFRLWMLATDGFRLDPAGPQSWDMDEWIGQPALPFIERFNATTSFGDLRSCMGAKAAVAQLYAAGHELHVVTACSDDPAVIFRRERNLDRVFGDVFASIVCVPLGFSKTKALSQIAESTSQPIIWIEDNHKNALAGRALGFDCWMMRRPHNLSHEAFSPLDMKWADDFDPILETLFPASASPALRRIPTCATCAASFAATARGADMSVPQVNIFGGGWQRAAKEHTCWLCGETIAKGEGYFRTTGTVGGKMFSVKHCRKTCECTAEMLDQNPPACASRLRADLQTRGIDMSGRNWKVVATSNFADETYAEKEIIGPWLSEMGADAICEILNRECVENDRTFYTPKTAYYKLWRGMEELI